MFNPHKTKGFTWDEINQLLSPEQPGHTSSSVQGINMLAKHLYAAGGFAQQDRMIKDKRRTLDKAVLYSYQGAKVRKYDPEIEYAIPRVNNALINPNKLKPDYDDKIISVGFEFNLKTGDVFEWTGTGTHWLIYLQDLTESSYLKNDLERLY